MKTELTVKERLLRSIMGEEIDRIAWSPFLAYYWESLPLSTQKKGQFDYLKKMGADPLLRGFHQLFEVENNHCRITSQENNKEKFTTYETTCGNLTEKYTFSPQSNSWFLTEHAVKTEEDFKVLQCIYEHMVIRESYQEFNDAYQSVGENGLHIPVLGTKSKTAFQSLVEHWCGTMDITYALYDFPEVVEECLDVMQEKDFETVVLSAKSQGEAFIFWEDSSTTNISPDFFEKYTAPTINRWGEYLHAHGKLLIHHACGHLKDLLPIMAKTEIDMIESISPPPTGNIDIPQAFDLLPPHIGLIGGIEPTFFLGCTKEELALRVTELLACSHGKKYILANSDSCPPYVDYEKFTFISKLIRASSRLP